MVLYLELRLQLLVIRFRSLSGLIQQMVLYLELRLHLLLISFRRLTWLIQQVELKMPLFYRLLNVQLTVFRSSVEVLGRFCRGFLLGVWKIGSSLLTKGGQGLDQQSIKAWVKPMFIKQVRYFGKPVRLCQ